MSLCLCTLEIFLYFVPSLISSYLCNQSLYLIWRDSYSVRSLRYKTLFDDQFGGGGDWERVGGEGCFCLNEGLGGGLLPTTQQSALSS